MAKPGLIIALGKPEKESEGDADKAKTLAAEGLIAALKSEDPAAVVDAFTTLQDACSYGPMEDDDEEEETA